MYGQGLLLPGHGCDLGILRERAVLRAQAYAPEKQVVLRRSQKLINRCWTCYRGAG